MRRRRHQLGPPAATARPSGSKVGPTLEEIVGTRWTVWVGGVALALGAILLVRYSAERGLFGPGVRTFLGLMLACALIGAGEVLRRKESAGDSLRLFEGHAQAHIPGVLTAAGTIAGFGSIYAAHALYGFIDPVFAFLALGATGIAALSAAAVHGPALAALGLVGSPVGRSDRWWRRV